MQRWGKTTNLPVSRRLMMSIDSRSVYGTAPLSFLPISAIGERFKSVGMARKPGRSGQVRHRGLEYRPHGLRLPACCPAYQAGEDLKTGPSPEQKLPLLGGQWDVGAEREVPFVEFR